MLDTLHLRGEIAKCFPGCPEEIVADFIAKLSAPTEMLVARAALVLRKPYGTNNILRKDGAYGLSLVLFGRGKRTSLHTHGSRREFFVVRRGSLKLVSGDDERVLGAGECGHSTPGVAHSLINAGADDLEVLEIFAPPLLNDKVRIQDPYDRALGQVDYDQ